MSLTLYPYVYLLARAAFAEQGPRRTTRPGRWAPVAAGVLPGAGAARAASLAAGLALVMMEVLTDFATVQYFGVQTVSVGVYTVWKGSYEFGSAVQLAALVMLFAVAVLAGERLMRGRARFTQQGGHGRGRSPSGFRGGRACWPPPSACWHSAAASSCRSRGWCGGPSTMPAVDGPPAWTPASASSRTPSRWR